MLVSAVWYRTLKEWWGHRRLFKLRGPLRRIKSKGNWKCHEIQQHTKRCRTKDGPPEPNSPFDRTATRCHPQNPNRFPAPKPVPRPPRSRHTIPQSKHAITVHQDTSGHATIWRDTSRELSTVRANHHRSSRHFRTRHHLAIHLKGAVNCQGGTPGWERGE